MSEAFQRIESYYAGAYWGPRKESPEECARRAEVFLAAVSNVDPSFSRWFQQGRSRKDALKRPIEPTRAALEKLIRRGKDRQFEDLGYSVWAWNGVCVDYDDSGFNFACGIYSDCVSNRCVFNLPTRGPNAERVLSEPILTGLVRSMVLAWEPDSAIATSTLHRDKVAPTGKSGTFVGWIMYFPRSRGTIPPLPAPVRIEPVEDKGTLIVLTPERFMAANQEHVALAERVRESLDRAGLL
ncbi:immunity 52 family protein [Archangium sp.]|uniref:immunity 52 family protein n=1 Tax=Archangium sp. TaxID=1872627 RepID=UPI002D4C4F9B|nr:immunity 52 family protein [Archangium sp.]HYO59577.1 immunity 52 family protein [Archangium sp.]